VPNKLEQLLKDHLAAINIGVYDFAESLRIQGIEVVHVDWAPPTDGDAVLIELLDKLL
jgi:hypothetical protein